MNVIDSICRSLFSVALLFVLVFTSGCSTSRQELVSPVEASAPEAVECVPTRAVFFQDETGSSGWTRTPSISAAALDPLLELLRACGGEIGFGLIRDESNRALVRVGIDPMPAEPQLSTDTNPFRAAQLRKKQELVESVFQQKLGAWQSSTEGAISGFRAALTALLHQPDKANHSDIWGAVGRAEVFLSENETAWGGPTHLWAVFVTDGIHNTATPARSLPEGTRVLVVNGSNTVGVLEQFRPSRFEAIDAAVRFIVAAESGMEVSKP